MKKISVIVCSVMLVFAIGGTASALTIELTLDAKSFPYPVSGVPLDHTVGTFISNDLAGQVITSAIISGQWGITIDDDDWLANNSTAGNTLLFGGHSIASTADTTAAIPWEHFFTDFSVFSNLKDGINLTAQQTSPGNVHLDKTTLTIETRPVPEPATMLLVGSGLLVLGGFRRRFGRKRV